MERSRKSQCDKSGEFDSRIGSAKWSAVFSKVKNNSKALPLCSQFCSQPPVDVDVLSNHSFGRELLRVLQTLLAPLRPVHRIGQAQKIGSEPVFIIKVVKKPGIAGRFRERT